MNDAPTVDEALKKGHKMVNYPAMAILFGMIVLGLFVSFQQTFLVWIFLASLLVAFLSAWLYWSIMITKWRIWAFENVRNVHELKTRAVKEKLIWEDGSFFERTEIRTAADKKRLLAIQPTFEQEDIFNDEPDIPSETSIYYSKTNSFVEIVVAIAAISYGVYMIPRHGNVIYITGALAIGIFMGYGAFKKNFTTDAQIILNELGMETKEAGFYSWRDITGEDVIKEGYGEYSKYYLIYAYPDGEVKLEIKDFATNQRELDKLLRIYRGRYIKKSGGSNRLI